MKQQREINDLRDRVDGLEFVVNEFMAGKALAKPSTKKAKKAANGAD